MVLTSGMLPLHTILLSNSNSHSHQRSSFLTLIHPFSLRWHVIICIIYQTETASKRSFCRVSGSDTQASAYTHTHAYTYIDRHIQHTHTHTHLHTYIYTHMHIIHTYIYVQMTTLIRRMELITRKTFLNL